MVLNRINKVKGTTKCKREIECLNSNRYQGSRHIGPLANWVATICRGNGRLGPQKGHDLHRTASFASKTYSLPLIWAEEQPSDVLQGEISNCEAKMSKKYKTNKQNVQKRSNILILRVNFQPLYNKKTNIRKIFRPY